MALKFNNQDKENFEESEYSSKNFKEGKGNDEKKIGENRGLNALEESITSFSSKHTKKRSKDRLYNAPMKDD